MSNINTENERIEIYVRSYTAEINLDRKSCHPDDIRFVDELETNFRNGIECARHDRHNYVDEGHQLSNGARHATCSVCNARQSYMETMDCRVFIGDDCIKGPRLISQI